MEDRDELSANSPDQKSVNEDLTADTPNGQQIDEDLSDPNGGKLHIEVDESLYDELVENSAANTQLENIEDLFDDLTETAESAPEQISESVLVGLEGEEFEATLADPFSPFDSTISLLSEPNSPQTKYKVNELDYLGLISRPGNLVNMGLETVTEVLETYDGKSNKVKVPVDQNFESGIFCHAHTKTSRFKYFFYLNNHIKLRYMTKRIGEILVESELISKLALDEVLEKQKNLRGLKIGQILAKIAKVPPWKIEKILDEAWRNHTGKNRIFAGDILVKAGVVNRKQVEKAEAVQAKIRKKKIGEMLIESGCVNEDKLYNALAEKFRKTYIDLKTFEQSEDAKSHLSRDLALELMILPLSIDNGRLVLATSRPEMLKTVDILRSQLECPFELTVTTPSQLKAAILKKYGN